MPRGTESARRTYSSLLASNRSPRNTLAVAFALAILVAGVVLAGTAGSGGLGAQRSLWLPFGLLGIIGWSVWVTRRALTSRYEPTFNFHSQPATVVAPAFREDP